jgi:outer membrane protein OmpA-like peptidoglycan-associated protein
MRRRLVASLVLALAGCGATAPSPELVAARSAYDEAAEGQAKVLVPADLLTARQALEQAERAHEDEDNSPRARTLAYLAHRKALATMAAARAAAARRGRKDAEREYAGLLELSRVRARRRADSAESSRARSEAELARARAEREAEAARQQAALEREQKARAEAEARAAEALARLEAIAKVRREGRGTVITMSGQVLFASGRAELLRHAEAQLGQVAAALSGQGGRRIVIEGHTDSRGKDDVNRSLSLARAEEVRAFLVSAGLDAALIRAVGRGEDQPVASNRTPEGRALNRRVEIVVEGP